MTTDTWRVRAATVGNPDFGQYTSISEPEVFTAPTLDELRAKVRGYNEFWNVGGGNWTSPPVFLNDKKIGNLWYNMVLASRATDPATIIDRPTDRTKEKYMPEWYAKEMAANGSL
jgi:hypothetical protein